MIPKEGSFVDARGTSPDPRQREDRQPLTAGVPMSRIVKRKLASAPELVMVSDPRSPAAERFLRLRALLEGRRHGEPSVFVVTSPEAQDGKSTVSANLALAFAANGEGTALVDADLRVPKLSEWIEPTPDYGVRELLERRTTLEHVVVELESSPLRIVPAGSPAREPMSLFTPEATGRLVRTLRETFRTVVIDTPPIVPFTDADVLGRHSDGVVIVARSGKTTRDFLKRALESVASAEVLGIVLNDHDGNLADGYGYYDHYQRYYRTDRKDR